MRRACVNATILLIAALVLTPSTEAVSAIVVGAGVSGLKAAADLAAGGMTVTVLEARDRLGGRVWTLKDSKGKPIEMGAQWIHGTNNPLPDLAKAQGWATLETTLESSAYYEAVSATSAKQVSAADQATWTAVAAASDAFVAEYAGRRGARKTVEWALNEFKKDKTDREKVYVNANADDTYVQEFGADTKDLSLGFFDEGEDLTGPELVFTGGYGQLVTYLYNQVTAKGGKVELNKPVTAVKYSRKDGVEITAGGASYKADFTVITVPAGVLKAEKIAFTPALPAAKRKALSVVGMGVLNKVMLEMPSSSAGWGDVNWFERIPLAEDAGKWREFFSFKKSAGRDVMVAFNAGDAAKFPKTTSDASLVSEAVKVLTAMFPAFGPAPAENQTWVTRWHDDEWSYGSYSYLRVGANARTRKAVAAKVKNLLYFAGEHTSVDYPATVQGAYISGEDAAKAAIDYWV